MNNAVSSEGNRVGIHKNSSANQTKTLSDDDIGISFQNHTVTLNHNTTTTDTAP